MTSVGGEAFGAGLTGMSENLQPNASPLPPNGTQPDSLSAVIQNFKSTTTRRINAIPAITW